MLCDLTIAADTAIFGQNGPRVGSFDAGFGTGYLARVVGEKRAREIWFLCRRYTPRRPSDWGLVNKVVPAAELRAEVRALGRRNARPVADRAARSSSSRSTPTPSTSSASASLAFSGLHQFADSEEAAEGVAAFAAKRPGRLRAVPRRRLGLSGAPAALNRAARGAAQRVEAVQGMAAR